MELNNIKVSLKHMINLRMVEVIGYEILYTEAFFNGSQDVFVFRQPTDEHHEEYCSYGFPGYLNSEIKGYFPLKGLYNKNISNKIIMARNRYDIEGTKVSKRMLKVAEKVRKPVLINGHSKIIDVKTRTTSKRFYFHVPINNTIMNTIPQYLDLIKQAKSFNVSNFNDNFPTDMDKMMSKFMEDNFVDKYRCKPNSVHLVLEVIYSCFEFYMKFNKIVILSSIKVYFKIFYNILFNIPLSTLLEHTSLEKTYSNVARLYDLLLSVHSINKEIRLSKVLVRKMFHILRLEIDMSRNNEVHLDLLEKHIFPMVYVF